MCGFSFLTLTLLLFRFSLDDTSWGNFSLLRQKLLKENSVIDKGNKAVERDKIKELINGGV